MESAIKLIQVYEANYPEYLHRVFVINGTLLIIKVKVESSVISTILDDFTHSTYDICHWIFYDQAVFERENEE